MMTALLLALVLSHKPVQALAPTVVHQHIRRPDNVRVALSGYCDVFGQPTILLENNGPSSVLVGWTMTAAKPPYWNEWTSASFLETGRFTGWMTPAGYLSVTITYDDDGVQTTQTATQACQAGEE